MRSFQLSRVVDVRERARVCATASVINRTETEIHRNKDDREENVRNYKLQPKTQKMNQKKKPGPDELSH